jgi:hypothetical protein
MTVEGQWCEESGKFWRLCPCCGQKHCCKSSPYQNKLKTPSEVEMYPGIETIEHSIKSLKAQADFTLELCKHAISVYKSENDRLKAENSRLRSVEAISALYGKPRVKDRKFED